MILFLWFTLYWKWLAVGAGIVLVSHFYSILKEAKAERDEEAQFTEVEVKQVVPVLVEEEVKKIG